MKKFSVFAVAALACLCLIGVMSSEVFADGTETLGDPSIDISSGSGIVAAGVGRVNTGDYRGGDIIVFIPPKAEVRQVLLYWEGRHHEYDGCENNMTIQVRARVPLPESIWQEVSSNRIGGPTHWSCWNGIPLYTSAYRADITNLHLVAPGNSRFSLKGLDFDVNNGAGVIVIYDNGSAEANIQLVDGNDYALFNTCTTCASCNGVPPDCSRLEETVPQTFTFDSSLVDRTATLSMHFSSVAGTVSGHTFRPTDIAITVEGDDTNYPIIYNDLLNSYDGEEWDSVNLDVAIPAGVSSLTVQALSVKRDTLDLTPASFNWIVAALSVPKEECGPCDGKITELTLKYNGTQDGYIDVFQKKPYDNLFSADVAKDGLFDFSGSDADKKGTMGTEISICVEVGGSVSETKLHTSCSKDIYIGYEFGGENGKLFEVIEGASRKGGPLCPQVQQP